MPNIHHYNADWTRWKVCIEHFLELIFPIKNLFYRPQVYQETSSVKGGPGGVKETRKTVQDSQRGIKKMAIGHHIGERAHIIEKEQDTRSGQLEERQDFINLDEDEAEDFNREFQTKARSTGRYNDGHQMASITEVGEDYPSGQPLRALLPAPPTSTSSQVATR